MKEIFKKNLSNPENWLKMCEAHKEIGDTLVEAHVKKILISKKESLKDKSEFIKTIYIYASAQFHYGIAIENGLKGLIIKLHPESIKIKQKDNGEIELKGIGIEMKKGHDLKLLAQYLKINTWPDYPIIINDKDMNNIYDHLTDMVTWSARYPTPKNPDRIFKYTNDTPLILYAYHLIDVINPLYAYIVEKLKEI